MQAPLTSGEVDPEEKNKNYDRINPVACVSAIATLKTLTPTNCRCIMDLPHIFK
ncbi:hypothetical protein [Nostoc sp.]|uniref:hypothetical protein n=1 Tax=Nostoc sp. TaxID=1180 RepID=UPI002FFC9D2F